MKTCRIHLTGASGAGVTTLGRALADALASPHHDTDDYFWLPTTPPYQTSRKATERLQLMQALFLGRPDWVLSGSLDGWGDPLMPLFDLVVFVATPADIRLQRLRAREARRYGAKAIAPGGWRHAEAETFFAWAMRYDEGDHQVRSFAKHRTWLDAVQSPVLRLDGSKPLPDLTAEIMAAIAAQRSAC